MFAFSAAPPVFSRSVSLLTERCHTISPPRLKFRVLANRPARRFYSNPLQQTMETVKSTLAENLGGPAHKLSSHPFDISSIPSQANKVALVTGGSEGIGYGVTHTLLSKGISRLYILSPSQEVVGSARKALAADLGQDIADKTVWMQCDLSDWKRAADVAEEIKQDTDRLDILVNNAGRGIMTYQLDDKGIDRHMSVNHVGHVVLTSHLLPLLKETAETSTEPVRISIQSSNAHHGAPKDVRFESVDELNQDLGPNGQYGRSKLANLLYARWLAKLLDGQGISNMLVNATHPGVVSTKQSKEDIHEPYPLAGYGLSVGLEMFKKDQFEGAASTLFAATMATESGQYICPPAQVEDGSEQSRNLALAEQLMKLTKEIVMDKTWSDSVEEGCPFEMD